jgi:NAD(P)-dependent dehydrogenase (short-subunit alcohol dehydrogenase family)
MNQSVLVTAGASGIGREIARAFAVQGAKVVVRDIDSKALETFAQEIPAITTVVCDVSKRHDIEHMVEAAIAVLAGLDVLVNNAGISGSTTPVEKSNPDDWEKVVQVNLIGTFNVTRLAIPHLKKSSAGVIIIMSSGAGRFGYANRSAYSNQVGTDRFHQDTLHRTGRIRHSCQCDSAGRRRGSTDTESPRGPCETER